MKWKNVIFKSESAWFGTKEASEIADQVVLYQRNSGGWPKNIEMHHALTNDDKKKLEQLKTENKGSTIDNGATTQELIFLHKVYAHFPKESYKKAIISGLNYLLEAQYQNGGWPQFYPLQKGYYTHITYNDDAMVNVLKFLQDITNHKDQYAFLTETHFQNIQTAFDKGINCILATQYKQNGLLTAWCAQHDENTLEPAKARAYELPSLSGYESANIVLLLMSLENPSYEVINAVNHAVYWFQNTQLPKTKFEAVYAEDGSLKDKIVVQTKEVNPIWARFMDLQTNAPFFCGRDGVKKDSLSQIDWERRTGYAWYTNLPEKVLVKYDNWLKNKVLNTKEKGKNQFQKVVAQDGSGDYKSIQDAIDDSPSFPYERVTILIKNGVYKEKIKVYEWNPNITLVGESREQTIIYFDDYFDKINLGRNSTFHSYTMLVEADDTVLKNLTIANTSGEVGQAIALSVTSNRVKVVNCNLLGNQDTLYASGNGNQLYSNCYIEGTTDFIFGNATALFENCEIHSKSNSFVTAASTDKDAKFGFVFQNCKLTADENLHKVYLGRPWRIYAKTVFMNCTLGSHILPEGWNNWSKPDAEKESFYAEYQNSGPGSDLKNRVEWAHQLSAKEAKKYTKETIFSESKSINKPWFQID
ncbi:pectate lyase [Flavobacterium sp. NRK F10]|uniref:pectate lyase n=1 Tax=Flavobacterium sp. NRK F10 TaxID=2954931 RepID=UPI00209064E9|nr:pectate lyase [Flavobacterium sp. NRK F10]MCO6176280.1 pectate lyase [Flavobacterium sp. NRK F10]